LKNKIITIIAAFTFSLSILSIIWSTAPCQSQDETITSIGNIVLSSKTENNQLYINDITITVDESEWTCVKLVSDVGVGRVTMNITWDPSVVSVSEVNENDVDWDYWPSGGLVFDPVVGFVNFTAMNTSSGGVSGDDIVVLCLNVSAGVDAVVGNVYDMAVSFNEVKDANIPPQLVVCDVMDGFVLFEENPFDEDGTSEDDDTNTGNGGTNENSGDNPVTNDTNGSEQEFIAPTADAGGPYGTYLVGESIIFDGSNSDDSDGYIVNWTWDFDDENISYNRTPSHTYSKNGTYYITLTVTDDEGYVDTDNCTIQIVSPQSETPIAHTNGPYIGVVHQIIFFDASTSLAGTSPIKNYTWYCGDETIVHGVNPNHKYNLSGRYTVILSIEDENGNVDDAITNATIYDGEKVDSMDGFLLDKNEDNIFDSYLDNVTKTIKTINKIDDDNYVIDTDDDGTWDIIYNVTSQEAQEFVDETKTQKDKEAPFSLVYLSVVIIIIFTIIIFILIKKGLFS